MEYKYATARSVLRMAVGSFVSILHRPGRESSYCCLLHSLLSSLSCENNNNSLNDILMLIISTRASNICQQNLFKAIIYMPIHNKT